MPTIAIYPGTFDPVTNGHADLVERALRLFDRVIVAIADNREKTPMFTRPERESLAREVFRGQKAITVLGFDGLLIDLVRREQGSVILRGLRAVSDFEFEFQMASMNRRLDPKIETVFMTPSEAHTFTSASLVKEIAALGGDVSDFVRPAVLAALREKLG